MHQVKFNIPAATDLLPVFVCFGIRCVLSFLNNRQVCRYKSITACFAKIEPELYIFFSGRALMIIKDATNTPTLFIAMPVYKIIIAFFFECRKEAGVKSVAGILISLMKVFCIFFKQIIRRKISSATKPSVSCFVFVLAIHFK